MSFIIIFPPLPASALPIQGSQAALPAASAIPRNACDFLGIATRGSPGRGEDISLPASGIRPMLQTFTWDQRLRPPISGLLCRILTCHLRSLELKSQGGLRRQKSRKEWSPSGDCGHLAGLFYLENLRAPRSQRLDKFMLDSRSKLFDDPEQGTAGQNTP